MKKILLPLLILGTLSMASWMLVQISPTPKAQEVKRKVPFVKIVEARKVLLRTSVRTHGTVRPRTSTTLIAEVPGIIKEVAPFTPAKKDSCTFRAGGFFRKDELLLKIEDLDLKTLKAEAMANLRRTELQLLQERELAKQAKIEWGDRDWQLASDLVKRIPQIQKVEAEAMAAQAKLTQATQDLGRSSVRAPFEGRILETMADVGQQVGAGAPAALARVYSLDAAEINFALGRSELRFLGFDDGIQETSKTKVEAEILNDENRVIHEGFLDRSEGIIDPRTRLTNLVVQVENCFANPFSNSNPSEPLSVGQFVKLILRGQEISAFVIPESAFRTEDQVFVVDEENRLRPREVSVIYRTRKEVWVNNGLLDGDRICITPIEVVADGMQILIDEGYSENNRTLQ